MQNLAPKLKRRIEAAEQASSGCITEIMQCPITVSSKTLSSEVEHLFLQNETQGYSYCGSRGSPSASSTDIPWWIAFPGRTNVSYMDAKHARHSWRKIFSSSIIKLESKNSALPFRSDPDQLMNGSSSPVTTTILEMASGADLCAHKDADRCCSSCQPIDPIIARNVPINQKLINAWTSKTVCRLLADLDHSKPFNDVYGYQRGDEVIELTGRASAKYQPSSISSVTLVVTTS